MDDLHGETNYRTSGDHFFPWKALILYGTFEDNTFFISLLIQILVQFGHKNDAFEKGFTGNWKVGVKRLNKLVHCYFTADV